MKAKEMANEYSRVSFYSASRIKESINTLSFSLDQAMMHMDMDQLLLARKGVKT